MLHKLHIEFPKVSFLYGLTHSRLQNLLWRIQIPFEHTITLWITLWGRTSEFYINFDIEDS